MRAAITTRDRRESRPRRPTPQHATHDTTPQTIICPLIATTRAVSRRAGGWAGECKARKKARPPRCEERPRYGRRGACWTPRTFTAAAQRPSILRWRASDRKRAPPSRTPPTKSQRLQTRAVVRPRPSRSQRRPVRRKSSGWRAAPRILPKRRCLCGARVASMQYRATARVQQPRQPQLARGCGSAHVSTQGSGRPRPAAAGGKTPGASNDRQVLARPVP